MRIFPPLPMNRRHFLASIFGTVLASSLRAADARPRRILLRSPWQTVNIGDIGHTPGVLRLLEQYLPDAEVRLWPSSVADRAADMLAKRFPKQPIVKAPETVKTPFASCDFLLHGSGRSCVDQEDVAKSHKETGKPFGVSGITLGNAPPDTVELLSAARFVYFRDSVSLNPAKAQNVKSPIMEFGPDGAFAVDLR